MPDQETGPCESEHLNIPISLWDANGERPTTTQANGTEWDSVVLDINGSFQIVEQIPDGYGDPMVFCGTLDEDVQQNYPATQGQLALFPTAEPFTYQCNWYNIPTDVADRWNKARRTQNTRRAPTTAGPPSNKAAAYTTFSV